MPADTSSLRLVVFADDWGRHPSSCQHLIRHLLPQHRVLWVNTIGTRRPRLSREDLAKAGSKLRQWFRPAAGATMDEHPNLQVISPRMWPGFRGPWQRRLNAGLITRAVTKALSPSGGEEWWIASRRRERIADLADWLRGAEALLGPV